MHPTECRRGFFFHAEEIADTPSRLFFPLFVLTRDHKPRLKRSPEGKTLGISTRTETVLKETGKPARRPPKCCRLPIWTRTSEPPSSLLTGSVYISRSSENTNCASTGGGVTHGAPTRSGLSLQSCCRRRRIAATRTRNIRELLAKNMPTPLWSEVGASGRLHRSRTENAVRPSDRSRRSGG